MEHLIFLAMILTPILIGIYTWNYARWAWKKQLKRGAFGLALLALASTSLPLWLLFRR